jgi:transposase
VISFRADLKIMLAAQPVDFRKSVHTLSALVSEALRADPYCGDAAAPSGIGRRTPRHLDADHRGWPGGDRQG